MMSGAFDWQQLIFIALALVLPVSALVGRRLNWQKGLLMALAWAGIFAIVALFVSAVKG